LLSHDAERAMGLTVEPDPDSTIEIVAIGDVQLLDDAELEIERLRHIPPPSGRTAREIAARMRTLSHTVRLRAAAAFHRGVVATEATAQVVFAVGRYWALAFGRWVSGSVLRARNRLAAKGARQMDRGVITTIMSEDEIIRLRAVASCHGYSTSTVVRALVLQEYQRLAEARMRETKA
jgi:hypothetical protein